jgi:hypothetical protein
MDFILFNVFFSTSIICGASIGMEYVPPEGDYENTLVIDFILIRLLIQWP